MSHYGEKEMTTYTTMTPASTVSVLMPNGSVREARLVANDGMFAWLYPEWPVIKGYEICAGSFQGHGDDIFEWRATRNT